MKDAAIALHALGPAVVLVKGGHLVGSPGSGHYAVDVAYDGHHTHEFSSEVIRCVSAVMFRVMNFNPFDCQACGPPCFLSHM